MCRGRSSQLPRFGLPRREHFECGLDPLQPVLDLAKPATAVAVSVAVPLDGVAVGLATRQERIVLPPVDTHLLRGVDRGDEQAQLDGQQLDVEQVDDDVTGDDDALVEDSLEDVGEVARGATGGRRERAVRLDRHRYSSSDWLRM